MFTILVACVAMSGCENKLPIDNSDSHIKQVTSANIKPLREADFVVSDSIDSIKLDSLLKILKITNLKKKWITTM